MSFYADQFRELIRDTLRTLEPEIPYSENAVELLMLTAAAETNLGEYLKQVIGPAQGVFQIEPMTYHDIYVNFLVYKEDLLAKVNTFHSVGNHYELDVAGNLPMQIVYARVFYWRIPKALPEIAYKRGYTDLTNQSIRNLANYWKQFFNTHLGKGTVEKAITKYRRYAT